MMTIHFWVNYLFKKKCGVTNQTYNILSGRLKMDEN